MEMAIAVIVCITLGLAFLAVIGAAVALLLIRLLPGKATPLEILDERYARGEIDAQQFDEMRRRLLDAQPTTRRAA